MAFSWQAVLACRKYLIVILVPLVFLPLPLVLPTKEALCGYVIIVMAIFWCTEALPLAVTALLPVLLFPLMNIMDSTTVCQEYLKDTNMLFLGGLVMAIAIETWNLHKRVALRVLLITGVRPALLLMGFMVVTAFLSMWISNTATTAMMVPIAQAVMEQLHKSEAESGTTGQVSEHTNKAFELQEKSPDSSKEPEEKGNSHVVVIEEEKKRKEELEKKHLKLSKGMSLCICYSSSIGGIATLTGTTPNLVLQGQVNDIFPNNGGIINFASWFSFAFPTMLVLLILAWIWLQILYLGFNFKKNFGCGVSPAAKAKEKQAYEIIKEESKKLGKMSFAEIEVLILFVLLVVLWFTREPGFIPGWATVLFNKDNTSYVTDATVALFISILLFILPSGFSNQDREQEQTGEAKFRAPPPLLGWKVVQEKMPWNIVFLLGGGFALAKGSEESGLSAWLGTKLTPLQSIPHPAIVFLLCLLIATFTECTSNVATTTLFLPILASMAEAICLNPLYVMLPCTLSASLAFMLPVATPPNAIVFSYGQLRVIDMAKAGFVLNILGVLTITLAINTWASSLFQLQTFPSWANRTGTCL
ncbi:solute carrier family 13 member 2 isoform X1 [Ammospiza nelsoni]|uniref:solute carrier family 13 member 2 isoform X1 n=1 Tax=Ammospiza nelsoni TaxID=2857394 RepID=UPI00286B5061|nr:solute carrier family 13 member 2 isoform X1 [Ammospiza nelsoni]